ncbi:hypothetical protein RCH13_001246 [Chryseobacterium sp. MP_3.2]|nr:hypothetical protein [Chryseobacterium sp. MP_3.2]
MSNQYMYGNKISNLDDGYTVAIKKEEIAIILPYYGTGISKKAGQEPHYIQLTSTDFDLENVTQKKGTSVYEVALDDQTDIKKNVPESFLPMENQTFRLHLVTDNPFLMKGI